MPFKINLGEKEKKIGHAARDQGQGNEPENTLRLESISLRLEVYLIVSFVRTTDIKYDAWHMQRLGHPHHTVM